jgi:hypothetical protein
MNAILRNPHHKSGAVIARIAVTAATIIWSIVGLYNDGVLLPAPYGPMMLRYGPEAAYGWFFLSISSFMLYRIVRQSKPHPVGIIGYGILGVGWLYVDVVLWLFVRPMYPAALAWVTVGTALAVYAFIANPRGAPHVASG